MAKNSLSVFKILVQVVVIILLTACAKQPKADFTMEKTHYTEGDFVVCINNSTDAKSSKWTFPDGTTSMQRNASWPIMPGTAAGEKAIKLEVFYGRNKSDEITKTFTLNPQYCTLTVWASNSAQSLSVYLDNAYWGVISTYYTSDPGCNAAGCLSKVLAPGDHTLQVTNGSLMWSSTVNIGSSNCQTYKLN